MPEDHGEALGYNGLARPTPGLPAAWYIDPAHHAREMREIWGREWLYLAPALRLAAPASSLALDLAGQRLLAVRGEDGRARVFHNVCRHRGATLCAEGEGRIESRRIVCPYHAWTYDLTGRLLAIGHMRPLEGFERAEHGLFEVAAVERQGLIFVRLDSGPGPAAEADFDRRIAPALGLLANWRIEGLVSGHRRARVIGCNWKVFWENYNECLHCPGVHPALSELVPIYGRGIMVREDDPEWRQHADDPAPHRSGRLRPGAETWSTDGRAQARLPGLTDAEAEAGHSYATLYPSVFAVGHVDHVRIVTLRPLGPETTELAAEWLFLPETLADPGFRIQPILDFARQVMEEDAAMCELTQQGMHARPFAHATLMGEEYELAAFHDWVRRRLGEDAPA